MNRFLTSSITKAVLLLIGYVAAVMVLRGTNWSFNYYMGQAFGFGMPLAMGTLPTLLFSVFLLVCMVLLVVSVWKKRSVRKPHAWRTVDYSFLAILTYCTVFGVSCFALGFARFDAPILLVPLTALVYLAVMLFLIETLARIRDRQIQQTLYMPVFFRVYPARQPKGLIMALLLVGCLFLLFVFCPFVAISTGQLTLELLFVLVPSTIFVITLNYFCRSMLSLAEEYEIANAQKIQAERFKVELITNVSHDIRSPLTSIINYVGFLKELPVENDEFTEYVGILDKKSSRLKLLIDDLMEASKASTGNLSVETREIDLVEIVGQITGECDDKFAERGLTLVFYQPDLPVIVQADNRHLWRVLENLFENVAKYALQGTRVFAEIYLCDGVPVFSLKNISQNPLDLSGTELTEQFIRGDRARQSEGSGLGLYIAKNLVELMQGRFEIRTSGDLFEAVLSFCPADS